MSRETRSILGWILSTIFSGIFAGALFDGTHHNKTGQIILIIALGIAAFIGGICFATFAFDYRCSNERKVCK